MNKEVLIVGQGIAGSILGYRFYEKGISFTTVDISLPGASSPVAAGVYNPIVFRRMLKGWRSAEMLEEADRLYPALERLLGIKVQHRCGILKVLPNRESADFWDLKRTQNHLEAWIDEACRAPSGKALSTMYATGYVKAAGYIRTSLLVETWRSFLKQTGNLIEDSFDFAQIRQDKEGLHYRDNSYKKVVFCEGWRVVHNPYFKYLPHVPTKGECLMFDSAALPQWGTTVLSADQFIIPDYTKRLAWAGSNYDWGNTNPEPDLNAAKKVLDGLEKLIGKPPVPVLHVSGIRPGTPDRRPYVLQHPEYKSMYLFNGLGAKGVLLAPLLSCEMLGVMGY